MPATPILNLTAKTGSLLKKHVGQPEDNDQAKRLEEILYIKNVVSYV